MTDEEILAELAEMISDEVTDLEDMPDQTPEPDMDID